MNADDAITQLCTELDKLVENGRQLPRKVIVNLAWSRAYKQGRMDECAEWCENLRVMMEEREVDG